MMKVVCQAEVICQKQIGPSIMELAFRAPEMVKECKAGQFVHIKVGDSTQPLLRRPISLSDVDFTKEKISVIYRILGEGTEKLARFNAGDRIDVLGPLGNGFDLGYKKPLLIGGGMGIAPLIFLAKQFSPQPVSVLIGGRCREELFWTDYFKDCSDALYITSDDGCMGHKGFTPDILPKILDNQKYDCIYACGPKPMLQQIAQISRGTGIACQVSLEDYMACGIGACLSCTCETKHGRKKVCTDGPVFWAEEVLE